MEYSILLIFEGCMVSVMIVEDFKMMTDSILCYSKLPKKLCALLYATVVL